MPDLTIFSLRGGMNNSDSSIALPDDQCILSQNTEMIDSMLADRRLGTTAIDLPSFIDGGDSDTACDRVVFGIRHLPTSDETASEMWLLGVIGTSSAKLARKTSTWQAQVTISDTPTLTGLYPYQWDAVSIHGKLHFAYKSNQDRLHVWDGTSMRRTGMKAPAAAPTAADSGAAAINTARYYRVRYTEQVSGTTVRRSEPSSVLTHDPTNAALVRVTKPATVSEGETHWELEASTDNATFYVLATTAVGTTTYDDATADGAGYSSGTLSEDTGDYTLIGSARYLSHDDDRLIWAGSFDDDDLASRVGWTPVYGASGVGNDERFKTGDDPYKDLDSYEHGAITGLSSPMLGGIWVFKQSAIYKLTRTGLTTQAYDSDKYTDALGAIHGSVTSGIDETGQPCIYFLDHEQGPCRIGVGGIKRCGEDVRSTWNTLNLEATKVVTSVLYYPLKKQLIWCLATSASNVPDTAIVLHIDKSRSFEDGIRKGWVIWNGSRASALSMFLYADNVDSNTTRSLTLVPYICLEGLGLVHRCDTGNTDNSVSYTAKFKTKPYWLKSILQRFSVMAGAIIAKAVTSAQITMKVYRDFEAETTTTVSDTSLAASGTETTVIKFLDNLKGAEMRVVQFELTDPTTVSAQWIIDGIVILESPGQSS